MDVTIPKKKKSKKASELQLIVSLDALLNLLNQQVACQAHKNEEILYTIPLRFMAEGKSTSLMNAALRRNSLTMSSTSLTVQLSVLSQRRKVVWHRISLELPTTMLGIPRTKCN